MLVVRNERTQGARGNLLCEDGGGGTVAEKGFVGNERLGRTFGGDFLRGLADHEGFGLSEEVGGEHSSRRSATLLNKLYDQVHTFGASCSQPGCGSRPRG